MRTLKQASDSVLRKLDDEAERVWTRAEVGAYLQDGYDRMCRRTLAIFDMAMLEALPGNHTVKFEEEFMIGEDFPILARFNFSAEWEREFASASAEGPSNYSAPFEAAFAGSTELRQTVQIPEDLVSIDRVTHDWEVVFPESHRTVVGMGNEVYETERGDPYEYTVGQDGLFSLRRVPQPGVASEPETITGKFGLLRTEPSPPTLLVDLKECFRLNEASGVRFGVHGHTLQVRGTTDPPTAAGKVTANAVLFQGAVSDRLVEESQGPNGGFSPDFQGGDVDFTIGVWIYPTADALGYIVSKDDDTSSLSGEYHMAYRWTGMGPGVVSFFTSNIGSDARVNSAVNAAPINQWAWIVASYQASTNTLRLRVNNGIPVTAVASFDPVGTGAPLRLGQFGTLHATNDFAGRMNLYCFWRRLLTAAEEDTLWNSGAGLDYPFGVVLGDRWGILRSAGADFPSRGPWGPARRRRTDDDTTRLEYYRLGRALDQYEFEIPDRFVRYVEWWALQRAYSKDGPGEDTKLAEHYRARFELGVQRLSKRVSEAGRARTIMMGGGSRGRMPPPMGRPPSNYGPTRPFRL